MKQTKPIQKALIRRKIIKQLKLTHTDTDVRLTKDIKTVITIVFHVLKRLEDRLNMLHRCAQYKKENQISFQRLKLCLW